MAATAHAFDRPIPLAALREQAARCRARARAGPSAGSRFRRSHPGRWRAMSDPLSSTCAALSARAADRRTPVAARRSRA